MQAFPFWGKSPADLSLRYNMPDFCLSSYLPISTKESQLSPPPPAIHDTSFPDTHPSTVGANLLTNFILPFTSSIANKCYSCPYSKGGDSVVFSVAQQDAAQPMSSG